MTTVSLANTGLVLDEPATTSQVYDAALLDDGIFDDLLAAYARRQSLHGIRTPKENTSDKDCTNAQAERHESTSQIFLGDGPGMLR